MVILENEKTLLFGLCILFAPRKKSIARIKLAKMGSRGPDTIVVQKTQASWLVNLLERLKNQILYLLTKGFSLAQILRRLGLFTYFAFILFLFIMTLTHLLDPEKTGYVVYGWAIVTIIILSFLITYLLLM